jgi:NAD(P)-dependent dehydrogenase (short-subunit alcohol dehydrogenase family)
MLAEAGATVTIADLNAEKGEALAAELGANADFVQADVTDEEAMSAAVQRAAEREGGLRISVCCAGIGWAERVAHKRGPHNLEYFSNVVKVNLIGTFNVLRLAAAAMSENEANGEGERGVCVNTASIAAYDGQIGQAAYAASKGGIVGLTLPAARDMAGRGVRVVTVAPGLFDTPLLAALPEEARNALGEGIPFPSRLGRPEEYAHLVGQIVANPMLNGEVIRLDGALRMPPK